MPRKNPASYSEAGKRTPRDPTSRKPPQPKKPPAPKAPSLKTKTMTPYSTTPEKTKWFNTPLEERLRILREGGGPAFTQGNADARIAWLERMIENARITSRKPPPGPPKTKQRR